ncbi:hypothetical protein BpHYR1_030243 [Brachionus plicatilis]|uniref:Uncharacterized protein n=1 Tax=Brachionus plicatilis TaxID=10195 RepID=A0A3M7RYP1_BRAPC|nr:hypothetical protein BpHYR1_030243 [Brachionus plicatilis]
MTKKIILVFCINSNLSQICYKLPLKKLSHVLIISQKKKSPSYCKLKFKSDIIVDFCILTYAENSLRIYSSASHKSDYQPIRKKLDFTLIGNFSCSNKKTIYTIFQDKSLSNKKKT